MTTKVAKVTVYSSLQAQQNRIDFKVNPCKTQKSAFDLKPGLGSNKNDGVCFKATSPKHVPHIKECVPIESEEPPSGGFLI